MQQSDILFPEKHSTIYFELLAEHIQYEEMEILRSGTWGLNCIKVDSFVTLWIIRFQDIQGLI